MRFEYHTGDNALSWSKWAANRIDGCERGWDNCVVLRAFDSQTRGVVVFHDWQPQNGTICMSAAGNGAWMTRRVIRAAHSYIFDVVCCQLAIMQVSEFNRAMNDIAGRLGYSATYIPRLRGPSEGENIWTMTVEDWRASRFNKVKHGKTQIANAA